MGIAFNTAEPIWLGSSTWAARGTPVDNSRKFISDVVPGGADMRYDATRGLWVPIGGTLAQYDATIPVGLAPPGTMGNNGAVTFSTALPAVFSGGYLYFAANAIASGVGAGFYWVVPSNTTTAVVYNNTYTVGGSLIRPALPTAFVTTGPGAYTNTTSEITCYSSTLLGGLLGSNGRMMLSIFAAGDTTATTKTVRIKLGGTPICSIIATALSASLYYPSVEFANRNDAAKNICSNWFAGGANSLYSPNITAIDTTVDNTLTYTLQLSSTGVIFFDFVHARVEPR